MKQLMKSNKSGITTLPDKGKVDFGEMMIREQLFRKGIDPKSLTSESQLDNILSAPNVAPKVKPKKSGEVIEVDFDKGRWNKAGGGRTGLSYLLAEDTNERMPLALGKIVKGGNWLLKTLRGTREAIKNSKDYPPEQINLFLKQIDDQIKNIEAGGPIPDEVIQTIRSDPKFKSVWQNQKSSDPDLREMEEVLLEYGQKHAEGGITRMPFSMGRRAFLKLLGMGGAGIGAAKAGLGSLFKAGKPVVKELTQVPINNIEGMPAWFKPLVNKVISEGDDVTKKWATQERQIVHKTKLPESKTDVYVTQDLNTGDVVVDIGIEKHGFPDGKFGQPVRLEYKASEVIEPSTTGGGYMTKGGENVYPGMSKGALQADEIPGSKGMKTKEEFNVEEAEFTGGHPENVKFEETVSETFGNHQSNFDEVEMFATGKVKKKTGKAKIKAEREHWVDDRAPEADDFASGGLAKMLGE